MNENKNDDNVLREEVMQKFPGVDEECGDEKVETNGKIRDTLDFICDKSKDRAERQEKLLSLDMTHAFRNSNIPGEILLDIWESDKVSRCWKSKTLAMLMERQFYGVNVVPLEYMRRVAYAMKERDCTSEDAAHPSRGNIFKMLYNGEFEKLDRLDALRDLSGSGTVSTSFWGQFLFHVLMLADYDWASSDGNRYLRPAVEWIERRAPGTAATAADRFGNNALIYLHATLTVSNPSYLMRTWDGIEMAGEDAEFLKSLGCYAGRKNVFGVSYGMLSAG